MKTFVYVLVMLALSATAAMQFCGRLETVSAARAQRRNKGRGLDLGVSGRLILILVNFSVFVLMSWLSKLAVLVTIVALVLSVTMTGLSAIAGAVVGFVPFFCLWLGIVWSSLFSGKLDSSPTWGWIYILLQVVLLVIIYIAGRVGGTPKSGNHDDDDEDDEDDEDEEVEKVVKKAKKTSGSSLSPEERKARSERVRDIVITIAVIVIAFIIGYILEVKFDFFPPYNH